jgi:hypothetical protein
MGKVAPIHAFFKGLNDVITGKRKIGANLCDKITDMEKALIKKSGLHYELIEHANNGGLEIVYSTAKTAIDYYKILQQAMAQGEISDRSYWNVTGGLFGYEQDDIDAFIEWITQDECPCPCVQCRPDLFYTK